MNKSGYVQSAQCPSIHCLDTHSTNTCSHRCSLQISKCACADPEIYIRGSNSTQTSFLVDEGREYLIPLKADNHRSASKTPFNHHRPAIKTSFKLSFAGGRMMTGLVQIALIFSRGSGPVLVRKPIALWFSRGSGSPAPLWIRAWYV